MKKVLIASGVAVLAMAMIVSAQGYTFNTNLTVGSTGADVVALQTWLIANGFDISAITNGSAAKGYFGSQTKAAVVKYQASKGIPSTGFVGPLTRGALNAGGGAASVGTMTCPAGFTCTANNTPVTVECPVGYTCTPQAGTTVAPGTVVTGGSITTPGVAGTLSVSLQSTPSNGTSVDKGNTADVVRYKLQAGASDMAVSSIALDFDSRFWLYASSVTVKDESGAVVASKSGLTQNDFTELTVGSSYRLFLPVNYVVPKAGIRYFTVAVSILPVTDRDAATLSITQVQVRAVDGTGVNDTQTLASTRSFSYTGGNNGQIVVTVNGSSPLKKLVQISTSAETDNVVLAVLDVKSQNRDGNLRSVSFTVRTSGPAVSTVFSDIKIKAGSLTYSADSVASTTTFTNMNIPLPKDVYVPITLLAKVAKDTNNALDGVSASTTLAAAGTNGGTSNIPSVEDSTFNTIDVNEGTFISSDQVFSASSAVVSNMVAKLGTGIQSSNTTVKYPIDEMSFTLTAGDNTLYVSAVPGIALATTSSQTANSGTTTLTDVTATPGTVSGDTSTYYVVPAGQSRNFKYAGLSDNTPGTGVTSGLKTFKITGIKYGTSSSNLVANTIDYNLDALKVTPTF